MRTLYEAYENSKTIESAVKHSFKEPLIALKISSGIPEDLCDITIIYLSPEEADEFAREVAFNVHKIREIQKSRLPWWKRWL